MEKKKNLKGKCGHACCFFLHWSPPELGKKSQLMKTTITSSVRDNIDIDDDNDGILDIDEMQLPQTYQNEVDDTSGWTQTDNTAVRFFDAVAGLAGPLQLRKTKSDFATCAIARCASGFSLARFGQPYSASAPIAASTLLTSVAGP